MYGVELALGGADAAADALVGIDHAAAAAQAAGGLGLDLLRREGDALILHGKDLFLVDAGLAACGLAVAVRRKNDVFLIKLVEVSGVAVDGQGLANVHKAVDGHGALTAGGNGVDGVLRAGGAVAANEDVGLGRLEGDVVALDDSAVRSLGRGALEQIAVLGSLADGDIDAGAGDGHGLLLVVYGMEPAGLVSHGQAAHELHARDLAVLAQNAFRTPAVVDDDAVADACVLLVGNGGHLFILLKADHVDLALAHADCGARHVDGRVAAADDHGVALGLLGLAGVDIAQEVKAALDALQILALDVQLESLLQADGHIEGLVALLAQLRDGNVLADFNAALELHAHFAQNIYL